MGRVQDKVAIVTGGAAGIGLATARRLAAEGARVVITDVDAKAGEAVSGPDLVFMVHDVTSEADWQRVIQATVERFGGLDILVNNAGIGSPAVNPEQVDLAQWRRVQSVNLEGSLLGCKYAMPGMRARGGGSIVNISSVAAFVPTANDLVYGTSKAGLLQLTRSLALHCARIRSNIRVNSVHPGAIETAGMAARRSAEIRQQVADSIPMGCMGRPEDIANAVLYLASDDSTYVTGTALVVDGGYTLAPDVPRAPPIETQSRP